MRAEHSTNKRKASQPFAGLWRILWNLTVAAMLLLPAAQAQPTEHQLKAAVLGNVAKFVEWPEGKNSEPVTIGILGHDPFGNDLEIVLRNVKVKGKSIGVKRSDDIKDLDNCHLIFISAREGKRAKEWIQKIRKLPILTVGEDAHFLEAGGGIILETEQRKIQISINLPSVDMAGITVNPQLLSLAKTVTRKEAQ
jgi:hypothetical protein